MKKKTLIILFSMILALASGLTGWSQESAGAQEKSKADQTKQEALAKALYESAKKNVYDKSYQNAISQFQALRNNYAQSVYGQEGLYWLGYSLNKYAADLGDVKQQLEMKQAAIENLNSLLKNYPANDWARDAKILQLQIAEELVRSGLGKYRKYINGSVEGGVEGGIEGGVGGDLGLPEPPDAPNPPVPSFYQNQKSMDPDTELKLVALNALMGMDAEKAFPILEKMVREEKRPELREQALFVLSQHDSPKVLPILIAIAEKDPSPEMRKKAIFWLGQRDEEQSFAALMKIYDTADPEVKENLIMAFAQSDNPKGIAKITEIVKNEKDPEIRSKAIFWYGQTEGEKALPLLLDVYKTTANEKMKEQILFAVAQADGPKGVSTLIDMARKETNFELKKKLIFWIGQSDSPEAIKFIQELIEK